MRGSQPQSCLMSRRRVRAPSDCACGCATHTARRHSYRCPFAAVPLPPRKWVGGLWHQDRWHIGARASSVILPAWLSCLPCPHLGTWRDLSGAGNNKAPAGIRSRRLGASTLSATHATRTLAVVALNTLLLCSAVDVYSPPPPLLSPTRTGYICSRRLSLVASDRHGGSGSRRHRPLV